MGLRVSLPRRRDDEIQAICDATSRAMIKTGTYTGNGVDNRDIDIGVDLAAKSNAYVIVKGNSGAAAKHRIEYGQGDLTMDLSSGTDIPDAIQAFTATGFQVGAGSYANENGILIRYIAFWTEPEP